MAKRCDCGEESCEDCKGRPYGAWSLEQALASDMAAPHSLWKHILLAAAKFGEIADITGSMNTLMAAGRRFPFSGNELKCFLGFGEAIAVLGHPDLNEWEDTVKKDKRRGVQLLFADYLARKEELAIMLRKRTASAA